MSKSISYNPSLTVKQNAAKNGVTPAAIRYHIRANDIDRRYEAKTNIIANCGR